MTTAGVRAGRGGAGRGQTDTPAVGAEGHGRGVPWSIAGQVTEGLAEGRSGLRHGCAQCGPSRDDRERAGGLALRFRPCVALESAAGPPRGPDNLRYLKGGVAATAALVPAWM